jgi:peptide/nickel transport system substrate-binding protein
MDAVQAMMDEAGLDNWVDLYNLKVAGDGRWTTPSPKLWAWVLDEGSGYTADAVQVTATRNPYYFKVDPDGNQYPYIDKVVWNVGADVETLVLQALNGDIDFQDRHIATLANKAVFFDNAEAGDYGFVETVPSSMNTAAIALNLTDLDPVKREIFQNHDFRAALSIAIDRQAIIDLVYVGQGEPYQMAPRPTSPYYNEQLAKQYTEYDPDLANQMLDDAGFADKDADGFRLGPDGNRITFDIDVISTLDPAWPDVVEQVVGYWQAVGIDARESVVERSLLYERKAANQQDASVWGGDGGLEVVLEPRWYFPYSNETHFAEAWQYWFNGPDDPRAEEPSEPAKMQMDFYNQLKSTADPDQQKALMDQILQIAADQFWVMGISLPANGYAIKKNNFHNVLESYPNAWLYPHPGPTNPFQFYIGG